MEVIELTLSPPVFLQGNIGGVQRGGGFKNTSKIPRFRLYRAVKSQGKRRKNGRGLSERSEFRRPRRRLRRQTQKPDNRGGASWFVLLAVEKNKRIESIIMP